MTGNNFRQKIFDTLDSTNAQARREAAAGDSGPLWIVAQSQSAGRGRRDRHWVSKSGNLFATLLITVPVPAPIAAQISFVTALAIHDACAAVLPTKSQLTLKWPNDVLLEQKKLAGILIETLASEKRHSLTLAIGCGVNLQHAPQDIAYGATWLNAHLHQPVSRRDVLDNLARCMKVWLDIWQYGQGFDLIAKAWQERASHIGKIISLTSDNQTTTGRFLRLSSDGALVLELADGKKQQFHAGDVSFRSTDV